MSNLPAGVAEAVEALSAGWWQPRTNNERQSNSGQKRELAAELTAYVAYGLAFGNSYPSNAELMAAGAIILGMRRSGPRPGHGVLLVASHYSGIRQNALASPPGYVAEYGDE